MLKKIPLIIIAGPTGIGKSLLGMNIAEKLNTEIISADSRQIFRYFDIGTAKPSLEEQKQIKHHLIDIKSPEESFTVAEYIEMAKEIISDIYHRGKIPLMVGGTGLYIKSLIEGFSIPKVEPLPEYREELKLEAEKYGNKYLYDKARQIDPEAIEKIHENDLFRVIRILEVYKSSGKNLSSQRGRAEEMPYDIIYAGLNTDRELLYERIGIRVEQMVEEGLIKEVKFIMDKFGKDLPLLKTINYREIKEYILGVSSLEDARELMKKDTRNFAKRQLTWFRNDPHINWYKLDKKEDVKILCAEICEQALKKVNQ